MLFCDQTTSLEFNMKTLSVWVEVGFSAFTPKTEIRQHARPLDFLCLCPSPHCPVRWDVNYKLWFYLVTLIQLQRCSAQDLKIFLRLPKGLGLGLDSLVFCCRSWLWDYRWDRSEAATLDAFHGSAEDSALWRDPDQSRLGPDCCPLCWVRSTCTEM